MKPWFWILCGAMLLGLGAQEIKLEERRPAALLYIKGQEEIIVETDLGDKGSGRDLEEALKDLQERTAGNVLLDTLQDLVVDKHSLQIMDQAEKLLHPGIRVCASQGRLAPEKARAYLKIHGKGQSLLKWRQGETGLPILIMEETGFRWMKQH